MVQLEPMSDLEISTGNLQIPPDTLEQLLAIAKLADQATAYTTFADYQELKSNNTLQAQQKDLDCLLYTSDAADD